MTFLLVLAVVALLRALAGGSRWWWALYAVSACAALWSHYTAVFVVAVTVLWALWAHRGHARAVIGSAVAIGVGYLPWIPGFLEQRQNKNGIEIINQFAGLRAETPFAVSGRALIGHPFFHLATYPGTATVALALLVLVVSAVALVLARRPAPAGFAGWLRTDAGLMTLLALSTLAGLLLYAASGTSLFLPRNLSASVPFAVVALSLLVARATELLPRSVGAVVATGLVVLFALNTVRSQGDGYRRPPYREATERVQSQAAPGDPLVEVPPALQRDARLPSTTLDLYLHPRHKVFLSGRDDPAAFAALRHGHDVFFVVASIFTPQGLARTQPHGASVPAAIVRRSASVGGPGNLARVRRQTHLNGITPVDVIRYHGAISGRLVGRRITWTLGPPARVLGRPARGLVEAIAPAPGPLLATGWALAGNGPPDWVLAFAGRRLVAISAGGDERPDLVRRLGAAARFSGWALSQRPRPVGHLRFFALRGRRAAELPLSPKARAAAP